MLSVQVPEYGVDNVRVAEVDDAVPGAGEVLIATEAATVNPADFAIVTGAVAAMMPPGVSAPFTPGWDLAGTVVGVGAGADAALVGSRVVGMSVWFATGKGTQSSLVALPASSIAVADDSLSSVELTTVGLNGLTAWWGLDALGLSTGETLVVAGAGGSVGGFTLELAVSRGVRVIAAVREHDRDTMLALGAGDVVATNDQDLGAAVRDIVAGGVDALLDTASLAGPTLAAIRDGGRYATTTVAPQPERGITVTPVQSHPDATALATLVDMASKGRLHTPIAQDFKVHDARAAYEAFANRPKRGRIVLTF
jgi:NADPH:quinone reductase